MAIFRNEPFAVPAVLYAGQDPPGGAEIYQDPG